MEGGDVGGRASERSGHVAGQPRGRLRPPSGRYLQALQFDAVVLARQLPQGGVAPVAHALQDGRDRGPHPGLAGRTAVQEAPALIPGHRAQGAIEGELHGISLSIAVTRIPSAPSSFSCGIVLDRQFAIRYRLLARETNRLERQAELGNPVPGVGLIQDVLARDQPGGGLQDGFHLPQR